MAGYKSPIGEQYVMAGLARKRADLAGEIEATQAKLKRLIAELEHVDATLLIFDPNYPIEAIRPKAFRPPPDWANRGEMSRYILDTLRLASEPLSGRDIALQLLSDKDMDRDDAKLLRLMAKRVGVALRHQRDHGTVRAIQGPGQWLLWQITD